MKQIFTTIITFCFLSLLPSQSFGQETPTQSLEELQLENLPSLDVLKSNNFEDTDFLTKTLGIDNSKEDPFRRGEIIFFASFSYLWAYQFLLFDIAFAPLFNDTETNGQLSMSNFIFSIASTLVLALMVTRKDTLFMRVEIERKEPYGFFEKKPKYRQSAKSIRLLLDWFNQEF